MRRGRVYRDMGIAVIIAIVTMAAGCASKQVASTSGDASTTMKSKAGSPGPVETIQQDQMASVPTSPAIERAPAGSAPGEASAGSALSEAPAGIPTPGSSTTPSASVAPGADQSPLQAGKSQGEPAGLADIFFDFDRYHIRSDAQAVLDANAAWLRTQPGTSVLIEGHCDERGTLAYNLVLGEKRALSTKRYLEDLGIPGSRIQTTSYGEVRPFCKDHNEGCWSKNRRAHFVVQ
jgi:peptidoglycan-associated lipoprotein